MGLHVSLTDELESKIHEKVKSGLYQNASEVVRDALRTYFERPSEKEVMAFAYQMIEDARARGQYRPAHGIEALDAIMNDEDRR